MTKTKEGWRIKAFVPNRDDPVYWPAKTEDQALAFAATLVEQRASTDLHPTQYAPIDAMLEQGLYRDAVLHYNRIVGHQDGSGRSNIEVEQINHDTTDSNAGTVDDGLPHRRAS